MNDIDIEIKGEKIKKKKKKRKITHVNNCLQMRSEKRRSSGKRKQKVGTKN